MTVDGKQNRRRIDRRFVVGGILIVMFAAAWGAYKAVTTARLAAWRSADL